MMKRNSFKMRILSLILAVTMASGTVVSAAETEKASGLAGVGNWFAERGKDIKEGASDAGDWIGNAAGEAWDATTGAASTAGEWIGDTAKDAWDSTSGARETIGNAAEEAWDTTTNAASTAGKWIGDKASIAWHSSVEIAVDVGEWMGTTAGNAWNSTEEARVWISEKANEAWDSATETVTVAGTWISDNAMDAWEKITDASDATGEWICDTAGDIQVVSAEALDSAGQWIDETGKELVYFTTSTGEVVAAYVEDIDKEEVVDYLARSGEKLVLGEYSEEDPTLLSIGGTLAASVVNLDIGMDIRDIVYDVQHLDSGEVEISDIALSAVGLIPIIGVIKPAKKFLDAADAVTTMAKVADDAVDVAKAADAVSDVGKIAEVASDAGKVADNVVDAAKTADKLEDVADTAKAGKKAGNIADTAGDAIKSIDDLKNIDNFQNKGVLEHIFKGNINKRGNATGYHYEGYEDALGKVVSGTRSKVDDLGVYRAKVEVDGITKVGYSTFFPENMTPQEIVDLINEAYDNCEIILGTDKYAGLASNGLEIHMYLDDAGKITTAFPIYKGVIK